MDNVFNVIKDKVSCFDILRSHGHEYGKQNIRCPLHKDNNPSFSVTADGNHFECFGCGKKGDCIELYELLSGKSKADSVSDLKQIAGIYDKPKSEIEVIYDYWMPDGSPNFQVVRLSPKGFRQRKSQHDWTVKGCPRTPFRVEKWNDKDTPVLIVEGEKDVCNCETLGFSATCNSGGAGKWTEEHSEYLKGRVCYIFPDNDEPGREHGNKVALSLYGLAKETKLINLVEHFPELPEKGDISDFIALRKKQGRTDIEIGSEIQKIIDGTSPIGKDDIDKCNPIVKVEASVGVTTGHSPTVKDTSAWKCVKREDVEKIVTGSILDPVIKYLGSPANPPLPLEITLPKALTIFGCALTSQAEGMPDEEFGIARAKVKINTGNGQAANIWTCIVAESGIGKDIGMGEKKLANYFNWDVGGSGSAEGLADALIEKPNGLIGISELQNWLEAKHWQCNAQSFLVTAFNGGYFRTCLSKKGGRSCKRETKYCFPNITANIQPNILAAVASENSIDNGFLNRFIFSVAKNYKYWEPSTTDNTKLFLDAKEALGFACQKEGAVFVPEGYLRKLRTEFTEKQVPFRGHWNRLINEYGPRLALILSLQKNSDKTIKIEDEHWIGAEVLIRWFFGMAHDCLEQVSADPLTNKTEKQLKKFADYVFRHKGATVTDLARNCGKGTNSRRRKEIMDELVARGVILLDGSRYLQGSMPFEWQENS